MQLSETDRPRDDEMWSARDIGAAFKLGNTAVYDLVKSAAFPDPLHLGKRSVRWWKSEVIAFAEAQRVRRGANVS